MQKRLHELEKEFKSDLNVGLSDEQVLANREAYGVNQLEEKKKTPLIIKFLSEFKDPLIIILIIAAVVSVIVDPHEWIESVIIMIVVLVNAILGLYQENKAEKSLEALQKMTAATCKVYRNNALQTINTVDLVVGDIIYVEAGDSVPADARIIECSNLKVEEAALTGESVPVDKHNQYIEEVEIVKTPFFMHDTDLEITYKEGIENEVLNKITDKIDNTLTTKVLNPFRYLIGESELAYYQVSESGQIE
jgi:Ca2+-transporting ATPase